LFQHPIGSTSNELQWIQFRTLTNDACRDEFTAVNAVRITDQTICTSGEHGGICIGDSGGILEHNGFAIGVQSWGIACATGRPDVFMRVSSYADWIRHEAGL
jgi:secreted trypsin-like serine protease